MKKFTALHVSDLHLSRAREREQQAVLCALYLDVARYRDAGNVIDAIFFTGDMVARDGGMPASHIYQNVIQPLLQAACAPGARFYLVPGGRDQGPGRPDAFRSAGFSFFSARERAGAEQRAVYKNVHAVFHGYQRDGAASSLVQALGSLFDGKVTPSEWAEAGFQGYSVLEFKGEPAPHWNVTLRRYDGAAQAFQLVARSTGHARNGPDTALGAAGALAPASARHDRFDRQLLSYACSAVAPKSLRAMFVAPPISSLSGAPADGGGALRALTLEQLSAHRQAVFFVGRAESGKTTLLNYLCLRAATPYAFQIDLHALGGVTRAALLEAAARAGDDAWRGADIAALLQRPGALVCFDNLAPDDAGALDVLAAFVAEFGTCKFHFTLSEGRERALERSFFPRLAAGAELVYLHPFGAAQARQLAANWFGAALEQVGARVEEMRRAMAGLDIAQTPFLLSVLLFLAERKLPFTAVNRAEMLAAFTGALLEHEGDEGGAAGQRDFLVELAYFLFDLKKTSLTAPELARFEADYFGVKGLALPLVPFQAGLCRRGLLSEAGGVVAFRFDCFRTYFLAQKFDTSIDLMRYAFTQQGFVELQSELDIYTALHQDDIEMLTAADPLPEPLSQRELTPLDLPDFGKYEERFPGAEPERRHSADEQESMILEVAKSARLQRRARLSDALLSDG